jgi:hypothetical protein
MKQRHRKNVLYARLQVRGTGMLQLLVYQRLEPASSRTNAASVTYAAADDLARILSTGHTASPYTVQQEAP